MNNVNIAVIDTNADLNHKDLKNYNVKVNTDWNSVDGTSNDKGHGTAVCSIILKNCPEASITVFPALDIENTSDEVTIIENAMEYIISSGDYNIINLSNGVVQIEDDSRLKALCDSAKEKNIFVISAYSNSGIMTYPAVYDSVIGVDTCVTINKSSDFYYSETGKINIRGYQKQQRVAWGNPSYIISNGSSFVTPYISGIVANSLLNGITKYEEVLEELKKKSISIVNNGESVEIEKPFKIRKAITFPFNKEIHSVVRFSESLSFDLVGVYDHRYFMKIGRNVKGVLKNYNTKDYIIENIDKVDWSDDFDTIIIGHLKEITNSIGFDFLDSLINKAIEHDKNIYTFDAMVHERYFLNKENLKTSICYYPKVEEKNVPKENFGKLWVSSTPVLGIMGTRSKQGKLTSQIILKKFLQNAGYEIGHLSSEPTGWLFGADSVFPFGYFNTVNIRHEESIPVINNVMKGISDKGYDLIMVGSQSGTVPYDYHATSRMTLAQTAYLFATLPDAVLLCVCPDDEIDYIDRTIKYIESSSKSKVIGLIVFPIISELYNGSMIKQKNISGTNDMEVLLKKFVQYFKLPCNELSEQGLKNHAETVIQYFTTE